MAPKITYEPKFTKQTIKEGKKTVISTTIEGVPDCELTWTVDGKELETGENVFVEKSSTSSKVSILETQAKQGGLYKLKAKNNVGEAEEEFIVTIRGLYLSNNLLLLFFI